MLGWLYFVDHRTFLLFHEISRFLQRRRELTRVCIYLNRVSVDTVCGGYPLNCDTAEVSCLSRTATRKPSGLSFIREPSSTRFNESPTLEQRDIVLFFLHNNMSRLNYCSIRTYYLHWNKNACICNVHSELFRRERLVTPPSVRSAFTI